MITTGAERWAEQIAACGFGFLLVDGDGRIRGANAPACALLGATEDDLDGRPFGDLMHPDDRRWCEFELDFLLGGGTANVRRELRLLTPERADVWST